MALALDRVGLASVASLAPDQLSGGQLRRVALARALTGVNLGSVRFLLIDEPTAQLDESTADAVVRALRWAADSGVGVLVATHDHTPAAVADTCVAIDAPPATGPTGEHLVSSSPRASGSRALPGAGRTDAPVAPAARPDEVDSRGALRWVFGQARPHRRRMIGAQALGVMAEACTIGLAGTAAWLIVRAAELPSFASLAVAAVAVRAFALGKGVFRYGERLGSHDATLRLLADLRATVVHRLARLAPTGLGRTGRGDLLSRLVDDIDRLQDLFLRVLGPFVSVLTVAAGAVVGRDAARSRGRRRPRARGRCSSVSRSHSSRHRRATRRAVTRPRPCAASWPAQPSTWPSTSRSSWRAAAKDNGGPGSKTRPAGSTCSSGARRAPRRS